MSIIILAFDRDDSSIMWNARVVFTRLKVSKVGYAGISEERTGLGPSGFSGYK
jgi:hypothetical protein